MIRFLVLLCFLAGVVWTPRAAAETAEDPVALAAMLVQDGHWDRARSVLDSVDPDAPGIDRVRLFATRGLLALYDQDSSSAISFFGASLQAIEEDPESEPGPAIVQLYLARAHMMANAPTEVLAALDAAGNVAKEREVGWRLRVQAHQALGDLRNAWLAAEAGQERFPNVSSLVSVHVDLALEMGLVQEAVHLVEKRFGREDVTADELRDLALRFRTHGSLAEAAHLLQVSLIQFPEDLKLRVAMAAIALERDRPAEAGQLLQVAAEQDRAYAIEAAEAYRRAGLLARALYMNREANDGAEKIRQRLGLLLEQEAFAAARALESRFVRMGIEDDDQVRYGLAYAHFRQGDMDRAEFLLNEIQDPSIFAQSIGLREAIAECRASPCL